MTGDMATYVFRTGDFGRSWTPLATADPKGYAHVVKQDLVNPDLLFLGTEFGLWISIDGGRQWGQFSAGLPPVAVRDLAIHPRDHDLVVATHGRGLYIVDDLTPLRALTAETLAADAVFLPSRPSWLTIPVFESGFNGDAEFVGRSPGESAFVAYYLARRHMFGDLRLEVYDAKGTLVSTLQGGKRRGVNRVEWPMRAKAPRMPVGAGLIPNAYALMGPRAPVGTYTVRLVKGDQTQTSQIELVPDPRSAHTAEDRALQQETVWALYGHLERLAFLVDSIVHVRDQARARLARASGDDAPRRALEALADRMEDRRTALVSSKQGEGISGEEKLREELGALYGNVNGHDGRPTASQLSRLAVLVRQLGEAATSFDAAIRTDLASINAALATQGLEPIASLTEDEWNRRAR